MHINFEHSLPCSCTCHCTCSANLKSENEIQGRQHIMHKNGSVYRSSSGAFNPKPVKSCEIEDTSCMLDFVQCHVQCMIIVLVLHNVTLDLDLKKRFTKQ